MQLSWGFYKDENERESAENPAWHPLIDLQMPESEGTWEGLLPIPGGGWPSQHHALCVRAKSGSRVRCWFFGLGFRLYTQGSQEPCESRTSLFPFCRWGNRGEVRFWRSG